MFMAPVTKARGKG